MNSIIIVSFFLILRAIEVLSDSCPQKLFQSCLGDSIKSGGDWANCDMCVCQNLDRYGAAKCNSNNPELLQCQLSSTSNSVGCRLILNQLWLALFSTFGCIVAFILIFLGYYFYGYRLYKEYRSPVVAESLSMLPQEEEEEGGYTEHGISLRNYRAREVFEEGNPVCNRL